jgi:hypothetical protein
MQGAGYARSGSDKDARYVREPVPVHFPTEATVPETIVHLELRTALYAVLKFAFGERATVGSDQFVYWDPTDPSECLAPDVFVRLGEKNAPFDSWKVWERGAPHIAIEIVSDSDAAEAVWQTKLGRYRRCGVSEVVRFDGRPIAGRGDERGPLRVWDTVDGDLIERVVGQRTRAESTVLAAFWQVVVDPTLGPMLRLSGDAEGSDLLPTPVEAVARARRASAARVSELDAELRRLRGE